MFLWAWKSSDFCSWWNILIFSLFKIWDEVKESDMHNLKGEKRERERENVNKTVRFQLCFMVKVLSYIAE